MNILYCGDQNIADGVLISVLSILKQVREPLHIYLLTASLQTAEKIFSPLPSSFAAFLRRKAQKFSPENTVERIDASDLFSSQTPKANLATRFTPCCMLRLYADQLPMLPEKILYLDNDVVCRRDFSDFYRQDMTDLELAGVLDHYGKWFFSQPLLPHGLPELRRVAAEFEKNPGNRTVCQMPAALRGKGNVHAGSVGDQQAGRPQKNLPTPVQRAA